MDKPWTASDLKTLLQLWPDETTAQIGKVLGRTRNAIIGKARRLKLPPKANTGGGFHGVRKQPAVPKLKLMPKPKPPKRVPPPVEDGPVPLMEAKSHHCRAIVDGQYDKDGLAMVCGKPVVDGQHYSYCSDHLNRFISRRGVTDVRS